MPNNDKCPAPFTMTSHLTPTGQKPQSTMRDHHSRPAQAHGDRTMSGRQYPRTTKGPDSLPGIQPCFFSHSEILLSGKAFQTKPAIRTAICVACLVTVYLGLSYPWTRMFTPKQCWWQGIRELLNSLMRNLGWHDDEVWKNKNATDRCQDQAGLCRSLFGLG